MKQLEADLEASSLPERATAEQELDDWLLEIRRKGLRDSEKGFPSPASPSPRETPSRTKKTPLHLETLSHSENTI